MMLYYIILYYTILNCMYDTIYYIIFKKEKTHTKKICKILYNIYHIIYY